MKKKPIPAKNRLPFRNPDLPFSDRAADLVGRLTFEEKVELLTTSAGPIPRLGIGHFAWGGECLHGICNRGRATQFPMPIGMAASFDPALLEKIASAIGDEARARHHDPAWSGPGGPRVGLAFYTPVINILRDPRWGRSQETYGEDPVLTGAMGAAFVRGLQGRHPRYLKAAACAKHLAVHSGPERLRQEFDARISRKDLVETYLPAFETLVRAGVATVMATYNRVNGEHTCASPTLLGEFLRGKFGFKGMVLSDGGALGSLHTTHKITRDAVETAGLCITQGCDQELGTNAYPHMPEAIQRGLATQADVDRAVARILEVRFRTGEFDPPARVPYSKIKRRVVQCPAHIALARRMAEESLVLVKNDGALPLGPQHRAVLCTGPNAADVQVLLGNFYRGVSGDLRTIVEGAAAAAPEGTVVTHMQGCFLTHPNVFPSTWTFGLGEWADAIIAVLGYSPLMEGENGECIGAPDGGDKPGIALPENQLQFLRDLKQKCILSGDNRAVQPDLLHFKQGALPKKPLIAVVTGGSAMDLTEVHEIADAVLLAWYPGEQGGLAVGDALFGKVAPSGKLPVTFPKSLAQLPPFEDYNMRGRTYRYMAEEPQYPFGFGLSYTTFKYGALKLSAKRVKAGAALDASVAVANTGKTAATEVVQLYVADNEASVPVPRCALKAFQRVPLRPGQSRTVRFRITPEMLQMVNADGEKVLEPGTFTVTVGGSSPGARSEALGAPKPASATFDLV